MQIILTIFFYLWLCFVAYLLYRHAISSGKRQRKLQDTLIDITLKSSQSAHEAAEAALKLAEVLEKKHAT